MSLRNALKVCFQQNTGVKANIQLAFERSALKNEPIFELCAQKGKHLDSSLLADFKSSHRKYFPEFVIDCNVENERVYLTVDKNSFIKDILKSFKSDVHKYGSNVQVNDGNSETHIFEFSSPNIAKPFHVGHLRSTVIGNCLSNVSSFLGNNVNRINYLGDWGLQFAILSVGYDCFGIEGELIKNPILHLYHVYVRANEEFQKNENFIRNVKQRSQILENRSNQKVMLQWQRFREYSIKQYKELYSRLGINFDYMHGESMYNQASLEIIDKMQTLGLINVLNEGTKVAQRKVNNNKIIHIPLITMDGTSLYIARDIAAAIHRKQQFNFSRMYYVVDQGQTEHFVNLKHILREMGYEWEKDVYHVKFGQVIGFSTRKGNTVFLEDIIDEAADRVLEYMKQTTTTKGSEENFKRNAETLGISSVIVNDLKRKRGANYHFQWEKAICLKSNSGISLQYSHARLHNLEKNCEFTNFVDCDINMSAVDNQFAFQLLLYLSQFDKALVETYTALEPSILMQYLFDLKSHINRAYNVSKVNGEKQSVAETRLVMFLAARNVLSEGMKLIGLTPLNSF